MTKHLATLALAAVAFAACEPNRSVTAPIQSSLSAQLDGDGDNGPGAVYTITNQVAGNAVAVFARSADGTLTPAGNFSTGGTRTGAGLGSQRPGTLSRA